MSMTSRLGWLMLLTVSTWGGAPAATLFHDVNVVMSEEGTVLAGRDVLVRDGRIVSVSPTAPSPKDARLTVVEGKGRYLLPGLAELHVHLPAAAQAETGKDMLTLLIAHGVTSIRATVGHPWHLQLREQVERGEVLGPRMFMAAPPLKADNTGDLDELGPRIQGYADQKWDFLKLHPSLQSPAFEAMAAASKSAGIPFEGHVPEVVGLERALATRMRVIDHIDGYLQALADPSCAEKPAAGSFFGIAYIDCVQLNRLPPLLDQTKAAGTWIVPTLTHLESWTRLPSWDSLAARPEMRFMSKATIEQWRQLHTSLTGSVPEPRRVERFIEVMATILREMDARGIPLALGSDTPQAFNIPGASTLQELQLMVKVGLTPARTLRMATSNAARLVGAEQRRGSVRAGMDADLILIDADPLKDITAVSKLRGVMLRGRWLDRQALDIELDAVAARAAAH